MTVSGFDMLQTPAGNHFLEGFHAFISFTVFINHINMMGLGWKILYSD